MIELSERQSGSCGRNQRYQYNDRDGMPMANYRSLVCDAEFNSVFSLKSLPAISDQKSGGSGVGVRKVARLDASIGTDLVAYRSGVFLSEGSRESAGSRGGSRGVPMFRSDDSKSITSVNLNDRRPWNLDGAKHVDQSYIFVVDQNCRVPENRPSGKSYGNQPGQVLPVVREPGNSNSNRSNSASNPRDNRDHLIEPGFEHSPIVSGEEA